MAFYSHVAEPGKLAEELDRVQEGNQYLDDGVRAIANSSSLDLNRIKDTISSGDSSNSEGLTKPLEAALSASTLFIDRGASGVIAFLRDLNFPLKAQASERAKIVAES